MAAALIIFASKRSFFCLDNRTLGFFTTRLRTGSFLAISVAISLFTRDTPEACSCVESDLMMRGGVACRRPSRVRIDFPRESLVTDVRLPVTFLLFRHVWQFFIFLFFKADPTTIFDEDKAEFQHKFQIANQIFQS